MTTQLPQELDADEELRARLASAEAANAAKSALLASVSHEIRTELSGILGMAQITLDTRLTPEQREYLEIVVSGADTLLTLVNDLLDASKIESGRLELEELPFSLRDNLRDTIAALTARAGVKGLTLGLHVDADVPDRVVADPGRLRQVITNVVGNAVKFTKVGGVTVSLEVDSELDAHLDDNEVAVRISVADTGPGISPEEQARIFEPYAQGGDTRTRPESGTGLGLSIVSQLVSLMGGSIHLDSSVGAGSTFHLSIPLAIDTTPVTDLIPEAPSELAGVPVLIVADSQASRDTVGAAVSRSGMKSDGAADLESAIDMLKHAKQQDRPYAITILDMRSSSFTAAERIRRDPELSSMHLVVIPGIGQRGDAARCRRLQIAGYLTRPLPPSDIVTAVEVVLGGPAPVDLGALVTRHWLRERRRHLQILVVDDSPANRITATRMLEIRGHAVTAVGSGVEAVAKVTNYRFDLILMDVDMPDLDGFEATAAIREAERGDEPPVPVVGLVTGDADEAQAECLSAGMDGVLAKPFDVHQLSTTIERLVLA